MLEVHEEFDEFGGFAEMDGEVVDDGARDVVRGEDCGEVVQHGRRACKNGISRLSLGCFI